MKKSIQEANPSYNLEIDHAGDFNCLDIPFVDSVMLMQARKLLKSAMK